MVLAAVDPTRLARQVVDLSRSRGHVRPLEKGSVVRMETDLAEGLPPVLGAESELREALINLVFNAVDAMPRGGPLLLRTRTSGPTVSIEVADSGTGMDEETRRRCLEPFYTTKGEGGTGLGLAMVYGIVQRHQGDLEIDSTPGAGTTIRMILPVAVPVAPVAVAAAAPAPARQRLLVVDDDPLLLKSLRDILEADGHVVVTASGGQAGLAEFKAAQAAGKPFATVITDLGMPHVDGRAVAQGIKAMSSRTPVIMLTGWGKRLLAEDDIPAHIDRVLSKPPKMSELRLALAECAAASATSQPA